MTRRRRQPARAGHHGVEQRVLSVFQDHRDALPPGDAVVAFSGGPDSLALLVALHAIGPSLGRPLRALHVDHLLRDSSSREAERAVAVAAEVGVPCDVVTLSAGLTDRHPGVGVEEAARRERYAALAAEAGSDGVVVTGHHADDQAETVLMHLARGGGLAGAAGMRPVSRTLVPWWDHSSNERDRTRLTIVRPFLRERRETLATYLAERAPGLVPVLDPSNEDTEAFRRNALRADALPAIERVFPGATGALGRFARLAADDEDLLDQLAAERLAMCREGDALRIGVLRGLHPALARRVVRRWLLGEPGVVPSLDRIEATRSLAGSDGGRTAEIGGGWRVTRRGDLLRLLAPGAAEHGGGDDAVG